MSIYIIAEVGPNHNGSLETALKMIDQLAASGADAIKFQLAVPENVYSKDAFKADYQEENDGVGSPLEMSRRIQLSFEQHEKLYKACKEAGVDYMCTAFDTESLRRLDEKFEMPYFKIASGEITSLDILEYISKRDRKILLSTGMATFEDIEAAIEILDRKKSKDITVLHCVSNYPAEYGEINLNVIPSLQKRFGRPVGFSDHSLGPECCLGAVALGAKVLEKHVTLDKNMTGPDHQASATMQEFEALVRSVRGLEMALGDREKSFSDAEIGIRSMARKSIVSVRDIREGEVISVGDIGYKRPGTGISPLRSSTVIGRTAKRPINADRVILPEWLG